MKNKIVWTLVALNILLAATLVVRVAKPNNAMAQQGGRPSDYSMIPGEVIGGTSGVVYIVDESNGRLSAMSFNDANKTLDVMPPIELSQIYAAAGMTNEKTPKRK